MACQPKPWRSLVEEAGVDPEVHTTTIRVYDDLPNVYRIIDVLLLVIKVHFNKYEIENVWDYIPSNAKPERLFVEVE